MSGSSAVNISISFPRDYDTKKEKQKISKGEEGEVEER